MLKKFGKWKESMIKNKYSFGAMVVIAVTALFFCGLAYKVPKVDAVIVADGVVTLSNNYSQSLSGNGNAYHIQGDPNVVYENVTINVGSATTVILEDVYIRQTTDQPVLIFGNGINSSNDYKLVLVGNSVIESTYVDPVTGKGASNPLIHVEDIEYTMTETDNILNAVVTTFTTVNTLVITDVYDGVNYNGSLTLINTPYSEAAVIGTSSTSNMSDTLPPDEPDIDYEFTYCRSGKITVKDEPVLNIVNKGAGAAIGGGGAINLAGMAGTDCGDVEFAGGTVRIILAPVSFGNAVGGGSAVTVSGAAYAPSSGYAGSGADVVITGGSLYIDNQGAGSDFGRGLGKYVSGIVKPGTVTDGDGDTLCVYIADVDADEQSSGGTFTYIDDDVLFGQFDLIQVLGEEEYSYKVSDVLYDGNTLEHINTTVRTTKDTDFLYGGIGYTKTITGVNKSNITDVNIEDISGKLYFYVPATQAKFYNIAVDANSKENLESVTVTKDGKEISSARWETEFKVTIQLEEDYELIEDGVYYVDENGEVCYARQESETEFYFTMPQADIVIYIDSKLPVYTITYMNDLNSTASDPVSFPTTYTVRDTFLFGKPSAPGMTFIRWEDENGNEITGVSGCKGNLQVYATWEEILYTVTFVDYDDTLIYSQATTYGGSVTAPADPVREHYTFIGWDKTFDYVTENIIVKAMYEYTDTKAPYEIKVDEAVVNGTVTADKENAFEDEEIIVTITPDVGYILKEVVVRKDGGDGGMISINKFQAIGGTGTSQNGSYMYSFAMPASDVEISATFEQVEYTITYVNVGNDDHNNPTT